MANGASRIFNIIHNTSENTNPTTSKIITLTVISLDPLVFQRDDKLTISKDFYFINQALDTSELQLNDIVLAFVFDDGQQYFIQQKIE